MMRNRAVCAILSPFVVITTIVYAFLCPMSLLDNVYAEGGNLFIVNDDKIMTSSQQVEEVETECKSPCPKSAETCITMCA
ncbi:MAG TPA: hypothetical protein VJ697_10435 [Nitrososphaeraceae archaeon]|jgi:hypothetical protein|nr:hypothetical protein [Nitrososphaeraceae archaeon]